MRGIDIHAHLWPQSYLQGAAKGNAWHGLEHMLLDSTAVAGEYRLNGPCSVRVVSATAWPGGASPEAVGAARSPGPRPPRPFVSTTHLALKEVNERPREERR